LGGNSSRASLLSYCSALPIKPHGRATVEVEVHVACCICICLLAVLLRVWPVAVCLLQVWDLNTLSRVKTLTGHTDAVRALSVSDGRLFSGSYDGTVRVWDEANLHCLEILKGHNGPVRTLVNCGGCMFSGSYDKTVRVWDVQTLECKAALTGHTGAVRALVASPEYVFSGSDDTTIKVSWGLVGGEEQHYAMATEPNMGSSCAAAVVMQSVAC
jgi:WD40 repeat protein